MYELIRISQLLGVHSTLQNPVVHCRGRDIIAQRTVINRLTASINIYCVILFVYCYIVPLFKSAVEIHREFDRLAMKGQILRRDSNFSDQVLGSFDQKYFQSGIYDRKRRVLYRLSFEINLSEKDRPR